MQDLKSYGIREFTQISSSVDGYLEELRINGFATIPNVIEKSTLPVLRDKVDKIYQSQVEEMNTIGDLTEINDANIARALISYDDAFLELAVQPLFLTLAERILGNYFILQMQNGIINLPNQTNYQIAWHRDLNYQHFVSTRPLAISLLVCLDEFSPETGGTFVLPGTHKVEAFPSEQFVSKFEQQVSAEAGSILVMDSMLYHRAGYNRSTRVRRGINHMYCLPFIKQQISLPAALKGKYASDLFLSRLLGYDSEPGSSVSAWRERKFDKQKQISE
jgi:ectoine hydroxylase-related dioxygenase (phytanoyl-CoA dioxygenase family)